MNNMKVLISILSESQEYFIDLKKNIQSQLAQLPPKGSVKKRRISGNDYYYLQYRDGSRIKQDYIGKDCPVELNNKIEKRKKLIKVLYETELAIQFLNKLKKVRNSVLQSRCRVNLYKAYCHGNKQEHYGIKYLGCSLKRCIKYIESKWERGMNWENYSKKWIIHHVKPLSQFDLTKISELKRACNYKNLLPVWTKNHLTLHKNMRKRKDKL